MKNLACSLIALAGCALSSAAFAARAEDQRMSGTVVEYNPGSLTIENTKKQRVDFHAELGALHTQGRRQGDRVLCFMRLVRELGGLHTRCNRPEKRSLEKRNEANQETIDHENLGL
jgi:hypothetical protein